MKIGPNQLAADLQIPDGATGLVIFAHGSGSSRFSPRNRLVAKALNGSGFTTLLFDLLTEEEASDRRKVFDIPLLARRVSEAIEAARSDLRLKHLPVGLFGASTGAAAALCAAANNGSEISAIVSRGGRPDLAMDILDRVTAPTLLIVGGLDCAVINMNEAALAHMTCVKRLEIVPDASHLFEEPGTLEQVVSLAAAWFGQFLGRKRQNDV